MPVDPCAGNATKACDPGNAGVVVWLDFCGQPTGASFSCGSGRGCDATGEVVTCKTLVTPCTDTPVAVCNPADPGNLYWKACNDYPGETTACASGWECSDAGATVECEKADTCAGNAELDCNAADPGNLYWRDHCGQFNGATVPCAPGSVCDASGDEAVCVNPSPCAGPAQKFCDPTDLSKIT